MYAWVAVILFVAAALLIAPLWDLGHVDAPPLSPDRYWGPGRASDYKEVPTITKFNISAPVEIIDDLKDRLNRPLNLQPPLERVAFEYGFNSFELKKFMHYWRNDYLSRWSEREKYLNRFPHFQTEIQGLKIHFMHVKPKLIKEKLDRDKTVVLPLLILHGWPGSVREFYDLIPHLITPNQQHRFVFEVIAPSLPGYGFSQASSKKGLGPTEMAVIMRNLMFRLGHSKFVVQGGDWGAVVGSHLAALYPENVIALHSNMCTVLNQFAMVMDSIKQILIGFFYTIEHQEFFKTPSELFAHIMEETGYMHLQATKPDTIGIALSNNPVGLAAYILEKFSTWTNAEFKHLPDGGLRERFTLDALFDNIMIYYITNSITTSQRLYAEHFSRTQQYHKMDRVPINVPSGCSRFLHDIMHTTDSLLKTRYVNLIHSTYHNDGGHFAAMEVPDALYMDFIQFMNKVKFDSKENESKH